MLRIGRRSAVLISMVAAVGIYAGALNNSWAMDDVGIIERNDAAHSVPQSLRSFFEPYWPPEDHFAGQYRPVTILSYAVDWTVSDGSSAWFHFINAILHGISTGLVVLVFTRWLSSVAAVVVGLVFAVHPVHVEAVANVVGRAELFVAIALLILVLSARRFRASSGRIRIGWATVALGSLAFGLLSKEHAVVGGVIVAFDELLDPERSFRKNAALYTGIAALTVGWLFLWNGVAGGFVEASGNATTDGLNTLQRLYTAFPVQAEAVRLLIWPMDLAADYSPDVIPRRVFFSVPALVGFLNVASILALAGFLWKKAPAFTFAVVVGALTYAPTTNLAFSSGVILGERNLYLGVVAVAVAAGWAVENFRHSRHSLGVWMAVLGILSIYGVRTVTRVPAWRSTGTIVATDLLKYPQNYRTRVRYASYLEGVNRSFASLAELRTASAIYPDDPLVSLTSVPRALDLGLESIALVEAAMAYGIQPKMPRIAGNMVRALMANGFVDSAITVARRAVDSNPSDYLAARWYTESLVASGATGWRVDVARAHEEWRRGMPIQASIVLERAAKGIGGDPEIDQASCWDVASGRKLALQLLPESLYRFPDCILKDL